MKLFFFMMVFQFLIAPVNGAVNGSLSALSLTGTSSENYLQELLGPVTWAGAALPLAFQTALCAGLPAENFLVRKPRLAFDFQAGDFFKKPESPDWAIVKAWNQLRYPDS